MSFAGVRCFNPRAREGATAPLPLVSSQSFCFNPRAREGATVLCRIDGISCPVSIHAPVRARLKSYLNQYH